MFGVSSEHSMNNHILPNQTTAANEHVVEIFSKGLIHQFYFIVDSRIQEKHDDMFWDRRCDDVLFSFKILTSSKTFQFLTYLGNERQHHLSQNL